MAERLILSRDEDDTVQPLVISVSSGKGGVGKTVLAANLARVLSWSGKRVLLVDLDLYNRGSTTLVSDLRVGGEATTVADLLRPADQTGGLKAPESGSLPESVSLKGANLIEIAHASGPSTDSDEPTTHRTTLYLLPSTRSGHVVFWDQYSYDILHLRGFFRSLVQELSSEYELACIIFDCRPGPEPLFLAAAGISSDIILVTEADTVTFNGNVNLVGYLHHYYGESDPNVLFNVQFVVNRVPKRYDIGVLEEEYERRLKSLFRGRLRPILASIPFDYEVFQSFTQYKFIVDDLPSSVFARHVAAIAVELSSANNPGLLSDRAYRLASAVPRPLLRPILRAITSLFRSGVR